jgi:hypothetical protein
MMIRSLGSLLFLALLAAPAEAAWSIACSTPGQVLTSPDGYVKLYCGNSPATVPHDGSLRPESIPDRTDTCTEIGEVFWVGRDANASVLASRLASDDLVHTGKYSWRVVSLLHRKKLDPNRTRECGAGGNAEAGQAWDYFHQATRYAISRISGRGFVWDIHRHANDARIELGYGVKVGRFYDPVASETSIHAFAATHEGDFPTLFRDFGTRLRARGYYAIPSNSAWEPEPGDKINTGGYSLRAYGCLDLGDRVCYMLVEVPNPLYRSEVLPKLATDMAAAMREYLAQFGVTW